MDTNFKHYPVMYQECIDGLAIKDDGIYLDGTLGGAGHSLGIVTQLTRGKLIANDLDIIAIENAKIKLTEYSDKVIYVHDDYKNIIEHLEELHIPELDGVLLDLGVSSYQIDTAERGFSYMQDAPLDMRMNQDQSLTAYDVVNGYKESSLLEILYKYGEENFAKRIVTNIALARKVKPIETTRELTALIDKAYPAKAKLGGHPAKKTFQAIRIEVNGELKGLETFLYQLALRLKPKGRMCVITFHSLEDRIVKHTFLELEKDCICDKKMPICTCKKRKEVEILTKKPLIPKDAELEENRRSKSAKLRIIERI